MVKYFETRYRHLEEYVALPIDRLWRTAHASTILMLLSTWYLIAEISNYISYDVSSIKKRPYNSHVCTLMTKLRNWYDLRQGKIRYQNNDVNDVKEVNRKRLFISPANGWSNLEYFFRLKTFEPAKGNRPSKFELINVDTIFLQLFARHNSLNSN